MSRGRGAGAVKSANTGEIWPVNSGMRSIKRIGLENQVEAGCMKGFDQRLQVRNSRARRRRRVTVEHGLAESAERADVRDQPQNSLYEAKKLVLPTFSEYFHQISLLKYLSVIVGFYFDSHGKSQRESARCTCVRD
jgi:hypothetical protein